MRGVAIKVTKLEQRSSLWPRSREQAQATLKQRSGKLKARGITCAGLIGCPGLEQKYCSNLRSELSLLSIFLCKIQGYQNFPNKFVPYLHVPHAVT